MFPICCCYSASCCLLPLYNRWSFVRTKSNSYCSVYVKSITSAEMTRRCVYYTYTMHIHPRQVVIMSNRHVLVICLTIIWDLVLFLIRTSHVHLTSHITYHYFAQIHMIWLLIFLFSFIKTFSDEMFANWVKAKIFFLLMFFFLVFKYYYFPPFKNEINWFFFISTNSMMNQDFEENSNTLYIHYRYHTHNIEKEILMFDLFWFWLNKIWWLSAVFLSVVM